MTFQKKLKFLLSTKILIYMQIYMFLRKISIKHTNNFREIKLHTIEFSIEKNDL